MSSPEITPPDSGPIPAEYPPLNEEQELYLSGLHYRFTNGDVREAQENWQIEQRLGAINDAREQGVIDPEAADRLELETLRKLRESVFLGGMAVPLAVIHQAYEADEGNPINVTKYT